MGVGFLFRLARRGGLGSRLGQRAGASADKLEAAENRCGLVGIGTSRPIIELWKRAAAEGQARQPRAGGAAVAEGGRLATVRGAVPARGADAEDAL